MATTTTNPIITDQELTEPRPGVDTHVPAVASLRRLLPYFRPALPALILSALAALVATLCGVAFPLVIQYIIDGPIAEQNLAGLWLPGALLLGLGHRRGRAVLGAADAVRPPDDAGRGDHAGGDLRPSAAAPGRLP